MKFVLVQEFEGDDLPSQMEDVLKVVHRVQNACFDVYQQCSCKFPHRVKMYIEKCEIKVGNIPFKGKENPEKMG